MTLFDRAKTNVYHLILNLVLLLLTYSFNA